MGWTTLVSVRRVTFATVLMAALTVAACEGDDGATTTTAAWRTAPECEPGRGNAVEKVKPGETLTAVVETNQGAFSIALATSDSPRTVGSFVCLAKQGFYDGLTFHRVVSDFVVQGGDPAGDGTGGPGYSVDEKPPRDMEYTEGTVAMAKTAAEPIGRSGSQFFVVTAADAGLPPEYAVLGAVSEGEDAIDRIESLADPGLGPGGGKPLEPVVIERVAIRR
jgi:peptidyl-prolyl cis-trans isomerase B (cyclophilin B)